MSTKGYVFLELEASGIRPVSCPAMRAARIDLKYDECSLAKLRRRSVA